MGCSDGDDLRVVKHRRRFDPTAPPTVRYRIPGTDAQGRATGLETAP